MIQKVSNSRGVTKLSTIMILRMPTPRISVLVFFWATLTLFQLPVAGAITYYSHYGSSQTYDITVAPGTYEFEVDGIAQYKTTEWYVNGVYKETNESGFFAIDPHYTYLFPGGTAIIEALVYNPNELHTWNLSEDTTPPSPNPMSFSILPYAYSTVSIRMVATEASDPSSVEYYFYCALNGGGGGDYGFTSNREYLDGGLNVNTQYAYAVLARDMSPNQNQGQYSPVKYVYTLANDPAAPIVNNPTATTLNVNVQPNGNPSHTEFAIYNNTLSYYVNSTGGSNGSVPVWRTDSQWGTTTVNNLTPETTYSFKIKARNGDNIETAFGPSASGTTTFVNHPPTASRYSPIHSNIKIIYIPSGLTVQFVVEGYDEDGNLLGAEWYFEGQHQVSHSAMSGSLDTDSWSYVFDNKGTFIVEATVYDSGPPSLYSDPPATWIVEVIDKQRGVYVDGFDNILGDEEKEDALLQFAKDNGIGYLALYGLDTYNPNNLLLSYPTELDTFIQKAKNSYYGILEIGAIGEAYPQFFDDVASYNDSHTGKFDVLTVDKEYWWNPSTFPDWILMLEHMRYIADSRDLTVEVYLGFPTELESHQIRDLVDRVLLHYYVSDPHDAYSHIEFNVRGYLIYQFRDRLSWFSSSDRQVEVWPIFSAEAPPINNFMGNWLGSHSMEEAEDIFIADYANEPDDWKYGIYLTGFQYFAYSHLLLVNNPPVASQNTPSNSSVPIEPGTGITFIVDGSDVDGNLRGTEWYLDGVHQASNFSMSGSSDSDSWAHTFNSVGTFEVSVLVFDAGSPNLYSNSVTWIVYVSVTPETGSMNVTIEPERARNIGAKWQVDGGPWYDSGHTQSDLLVGQHTVAYKPISGWLTPDNQVVQINVDQTTYEIGTYIEKVIPEPEINVKQNSVNIADDIGTYGFGNTMVETSNSTIFAIENLGDADLLLTGSPLIDFIGVDANRFSLTQLPATPVAAGNNTIFQISFIPNTAGTFHATVSIENSDADENPYDFIITGNGISVPTVDISGDGKVDLIDFSMFGGWWSISDCNVGNAWCEGADLDMNSIVNYSDLWIMCNSWLELNLELLHDLPLDANPGWATEGEWAFGQSTGGGGSNGNPDPNSGYTGNNLYGINLNGDYTIAVGGPYHLTAGPFDCNDYHSVRLKFARWLNTDKPAYVASKIEASNNDTDWSMVWKHSGSSDITDDSWQIMEYDISNIADNQNTVYLRWSYQILSAQAWPYSGWNIDDIELWGAP